MYDFKVGDRIASGFTTGVVTRVEYDTDPFGEGQSITQVWHRPDNGRYEVWNTPDAVTLIKAAPIVTAMPDLSEPTEEGWQTVTQADVDLLNRLGVEYNSRLQIKIKEKK